MPEVITKLAGLGVVALVALGALWLLLRIGGPARARPGELLAGYPADHFPDRAIVQLPALRELAATQARLLAVYAQLPPDGDLAIWLLTFLRELRAIMDTAYRAGAVARLYGHGSMPDAQCPMPSAEQRSPPSDPEQAAPGALAAPALETLSAEVAAIERAVAAQIARRLLERDADADRELLDARLAALRLCARQLSGGAA